MLLDWASYIDPLQGLNITPWSPAPALGILFLLRRRQGWPVVFLALMASDILVRGASMHLGAALLLNVCLTIGYLAMARLLQRHGCGDGLFVDRTGLAWWSVILVLGSLANSLVFVAGLTLAGLLPLQGWSDAVLRFWVGDGVGIFVTLPLLAWLRDSRRRQLLWSMLFRLETLAYTALAALSLWIAFVPGAEAHFRYFYVLFLPLVWAASRQGLGGAVYCTALLQLGMLAVGGLAEPESVSLFELQMRSLLLALVGFLIGTAVDEQRRAAQDLRQTLRLAAAGEMAGALAHELNQPLTALAAYGAASEQLLARGESDPLLRQTVRKMVAESARAADVVRRLRDFFRTGSTSLEILPLTELVAAALERFGERAAGQGIALTVAPVPELTLHADRLQLEVVLRNLLANAFDAVAATPPERERRVLLAAEAAGADRLLLRIEDSGPGLSAAMADRAFEPFVSTKSSGLGLGLAISRAIVEAHGGRLVLEVGDHGCVKLTLPVQSAGSG